MTEVFIDADDAATHKSAKGLAMSGQTLVTVEPESPPRRARHRAPAPAPLRQRSASLKERFDPRHNHLTVMRLVLAAAVATVHSLQLGFGRQPHLGHTGFGELAVDAFFVLSGFLLAGSYLRLGSIRRYAWHRFLRIMPGFWICLLITALVAAPAMARLEGLPLSSVFSGDQSAFRFLSSNSLLIMRQFGIAGLPVGAPEAGVVNGSLWTLWYEALCYVGVVGLGLIGALTRRPWITLVVTGLFWLAIVLPMFGVDVVSQERMLRFGLMFLIGIVFWLYADRVPVSRDLAWAALVLVPLAMLILPNYRPLGGPALAYLCLWLAVARPPKVMMRSDFSYGVYIYHWPVLQILVVAGVNELGRPMFVVTGVTLALAAAFFSWDWIEEPALRFKNAAWVTSSWSSRFSAVGKEATQDGGAELERLDRDPLVHPMKQRGEVEVGR